MHKHLLLFACFITLALTLYGISWGLPSRWCVDEPVTQALGMIAQKSIVPSGDFFHPTLHYFFLIMFFLPVMFFLKIVAYPLEVVKNAASVSWIYLSMADPGFSRLVYIVARLSSVLCAVATVYLTYHLAKKCYSSRAGIYSAFFLSVTMGFISESHTAKSTAFLMLMVMLTLNACVYYYQKNTVKKYFIPFFLGGLSLATKYNGGILVFPLAYYLFRLCRDKKQYIVNKIFCATLAFISGFFLGFPGIFSNFRHYLAASDYYAARYTPGSSAHILPLFLSGIFGYAGVLKDVFGVALSLLIISGIIFSLSKIKSNVPVKIILFLLVPYYFIFCLNPKTFEVKYVILTIPFLIILSSGITEWVFARRGVYRKASLIGLAFVWIISFAYSLACGYIYSCKDIRYEASGWIEKNIPKGQKIVILGLSEWVIHNRLFKDYDITLLNNEKDKFNPKYNRQFLEGRQYDLSARQADILTQEISEPHDYYIVWPIFIIPERIRFWRTAESITDRGVNINNQKIIKKIFRKNNPLLWNPNLGGYEPSYVVISRGLR